MMITILNTNTAVHDGVAGIVEEVLDRYDVFKGASDIVPKLPQSKQLQHQPYGTWRAHFCS